VLRRVVGLIGVALALGMATGLLAGCGGPPTFQPGPGKVRISPIPAGHGQVNFPANVTVGGTSLYIFTHGVRRIAGSFQLNVSAIPNPQAGTAPSDTAVQAWLGPGDSMQVDGLTVRMLQVYSGEAEGDVQVTSASGGSASATVSP
jgi:hypothetical protein